MSSLSLRLWEARFNRFARKVDRENRTELLHELAVYDTPTERRDIEIAMSRSGRQSAAMLSLLSELPAVERHPAA
jgi:ribosomal protein S21